MKKLFICVYLGLMIIGVTGCSNNEEQSSIKKESKPELYRVDVENADYLNTGLVIYKHSDNLGTETMFQINSDNSCYYQYKESNSSLFTIKQAGSGACSFSVKENNITITLALSVMMTAYPGTVNSSTIRNTEYGTINGKFDETGKTLILNNELELISLDYKKIKEMGLSKILINPKTNEMYDLDGLSIWERGEEQQKVQLDLSQYEIKDMIIEHQPWSTDN